MKIVIISDYSSFQGCRQEGRVMEVVAWLRSQGHAVTVIQPSAFKSVSCPGYPAVRLSLFPSRKLARKLQAIQPDAIHIATEGFLGMAARKYCLKYGLNFTSSYNVQISEQINRCIGLPKRWIDRWLCSFHSPAGKTFVENYSMRNRLLMAGFRRMNVLLSDGSPHSTAKQFLRSLEPTNRYLVVKKRYSWQAA